MIPKSTTRIFIKTALMSYKFGIWVFSLHCKSIRRFSFVSQHESALARYENVRQRLNWTLT